MVQNGDKYAMHELDYCEFYITNVCNLGCDDCDRFNNFAFRGHYEFQPHMDAYRAWSKKLRIRRIGILGGEPMLSPFLTDYLENLPDLWPDATVGVITNGTQFHRQPRLYEIVSRDPDRFGLCVSCHHVADRDQIEQNIRDFLVPPIRMQYVNDRPHIWQDAYARVRDPGWPPCDSPYDFEALPEWIQRECREQHDLDPDTWQQRVMSVQYRDANNVSVMMQMATAFNTSTLLYDHDRNAVRLHNSDPDKAIEICYMKRCHTFINGKLYKCAPVALLPEFSKQFELSATAHQQHLIDSYSPADADMPDADLTDFIANLRDESVIPQCSLCPERYQVNEIVGTTKTIRLVRRTVDNTDVL